MGGMLISNYFFSFFYRWIRWSALIKDVYFHRKVKAKSQELWQNFLSLEQTARSLNNVVQYKEAQLKLIVSLQDSLDFLDLLVHLKLTPLSPVLRIKKNILQLWFKLLKIDAFGDNFLATDQKESGALDLNVKQEKKQEVEENSAYPGKKGDAVYPIFSVIKKSIIDFLDKKKQASAQEIISLFEEKASPRTIYRCLDQLTSEGFLKRERKDKKVSAVYLFNR